MERDGRWTHKARARIRSVTVRCAKFEHDTTVVTDMRHASFRTHSVAASNTISISGSRNIELDFTRVCGASRE